MELDQHCADGVVPLFPTLYEYRCRLPEACIPQAGLPYLHTADRSLAERTQLRESCGSDARQWRTDALPPDIRHTELLHHLADPKKPVELEKRKVCTRGEENETTCSRGIGAIKESSAIRSIGRSPNPKYRYTTDGEPQIEQSTGEFTSQGRQ